ncbi:MAG: phosphopentomutase [Bacillota bacterium]|nr:phosphopentomutase [Bacillota bacterium]
MIKRIHGPDEQNRRVVIIVLDGAGVGELPDAVKYGDEGANTLFNVIKKHQPLELENLYSLGLDKILNINPENSGQPAAARIFGKMSPLSPGKDTTSGHWELSGLVLETPFPVFPDGFPDEIIKAFEKSIRRGTLGNIAASGTEIIKVLGSEHINTGKPIVYTSADSVFQIAAHEDIVPREQLYEWCKKARTLLTGNYAVGRVIARPFTGSSGNFTRTQGRHDYSLDPPGDTLLDLTEQSGYPVAVIGKVSDIFAHRGITDHLPGGTNNDIVNDLLTMAGEISNGLLWATLGDFDTVYGHRNDSKGFALALEDFDRKLAGILKMLKKEDLLFITADHGCDPTFPTTDHTREYVPLIAWNEKFPFNLDVGIRKSYADLAATAAQWLNIRPPQNGTSIIS